MFYKKYTLRVFYALCTIKKYLKVNSGTTDTYRKDRNDKKIDFVSE